MSLVWPEAIIFALAAPIWVVIRWTQRKRTAAPIATLEFAASGGRPWRFIGLLVIEACIIGAFTLAGMRPQEERVVELYADEGIDLALALDISATMMAADLPPNRLEVLKDLAQTLVRRSGSNRTAVFAFAKHCFTQTPLTPDALSVDYLIESLDYKSISHSESGGTAIGDALLMAGDALISQRIAGRDQVVVLVTDGENNNGSDPLLGARLLKAESIRLYIIGVGQDELVPVYVKGEPFINSADEHLHTQLDDTQLKAIAKESQGRYFRADSSDALAAIFDEITQLETAPLANEHARVVHSRVPDVALLLLLLMCLWLSLDAFFVRRPLR